MPPEDLFETEAPGSLRKKEKDEYIYRRLVDISLGELKKSFLPSNGMQAFCDALVENSREDYSIICKDKGLRAEFWYQRDKIELLRAGTEEVDFYVRVYKLNEMQNIIAIHDRLCLTFSREGKIFLAIQKMDLNPSCPYPAIKITAKHLSEISSVDRFALYILEKKSSSN